MPDLDDLRHSARRVADSDGAEWWARAGFVARGLVYSIVGILALQIAWSSSSNTEVSKEGALRAISERPLGGALLVVLAVGVAGYATWQASQALWGARDETDERKRTLKRLRRAAVTVAYLAFLASIVRFVTKGSSAGGTSGGEETEESWTVRLLEAPGGRWWVGVAALVVIGVAGYIAYRGLAQKFEKRLDTSEMGPVTGRVVDVVGTVGLAGRGAAVGLVGFLMLRTALDFDPEEAEGLDGTLRKLAEQTYGTALLTAVAVGIICFGFYSWAEARYRDL